MKIRTLKAEYHRNEDISAGGLVAKCLGAGLITALADDEGRFKASATHIKGEVFTHDGDVTLDDITKALAHLVSVQFIRLYEVDGRPYGVILNWEKHQPVPPTRFSPSSFPPDPAQARRKQSAGTAQARRKHAAGTAQARRSPDRSASASTRLPRARADRNGTERNGRESERNAPGREEAQRSDPTAEALDPEVVRWAAAVGEASQEVLKRELTGKERAMVLNWAHPDRDGTMIDLGRAVEIVRHEMTTVTNEGRLPISLSFCDLAVQALRRTPSRPPPVGRASTAAAITQSRRFDALAEKLEAEGQ